MEEGGHGPGFFEVRSKGQCRRNEVDGQQSGDDAFYHSRTNQNVGCLKNTERGDEDDCHLHRGRCDLLPNNGRRLKVRPAAGEVRNRTPCTQVVAQEFFYFLVDLSIVNAFVLYNTVGLQKKYIGFLLD